MTDIAQATNTPEGQPPHAVAHDAHASELSDQGLRLLADALDGLIYDWDLASGLVMRSAGLATLLGYRPEEAGPTAGWWQERVHPDDVANELAVRQAQLRDPSVRVLQAEYRVRHRDGHWRWVSDRARLIRDAEGRVVRMVGITTDITARRTAEAERERMRTTAELSLQRLAQVLETLPSAVIVSDVHGAIVYANPAAERVLGVARAEIATHRIDSAAWMFGARDGTPLAADALPAARALCGETVTAVEHTVLNPRTGQRRVISVNASPLRDGLGAITGMVASFVDVTEQVTHEAALRKAEERFRVAQQLSLDAFTILEAVRDATGHIVDFRWTFLNPEAERLLRRPAAALLGRHLLGELPGMRETSDLFARCVRVVETGEPHDIEVRYASDGIDGWFRHMAVKLEDGVAVFFSDITARKAAEQERERLLEAAHEAESRTSRLQRITSELSGLLSPSDAARVIVRHIVEALGASAGGVLQLAADGKEFTLLHSQGFREEALQRFRRFAADQPVPVRDVVRERAPVLLESRADWLARYPLPPQAHLREDGAWVALPLLVEDRVLGALTLSFERARRFTGDDRDFMMAFAGQCAQALERTRLHEMEREARREAQEANRAKSEFLAVMSHELRTPLNAIAGYTQLLEMGVHGTITEAQREALSRISDAQHHLLGLINQVINLARIEAGAVVYELRTLDLQHVLRTVESLMAPQMLAKGITPRRAGVREPFPVVADDEKLRQVLLNLLSNAVKFTGTGGDITLELVHDGAMAAVRVHDTGRGIPPEKLQAIFEPFVQVDPRLTRLEDGAGLGLAISRNLARGMGGDLVAASVLGEGSTFTLLLPRPAESPGA